MNKSRNWRNLRKLLQNILQSPNTTILYTLISKLTITVIEVINSKTNLFKYFRINDKTYYNYFKVTGIFLEFCKFNQVTVLEIIDV
jgi:uncharacterized membrane protein YraQ (UPF0718 family)